MYSTCVQRGVAKVMRVKFDELRQLFQMKFNELSFGLIFLQYFGRPIALTTTKFCGTDSDISSEILFALNKILFVLDNISDNSREQRSKFVEFCSHYFCTVLYLCPVITSFYDCSDILLIQV